MLINLLLDIVDIAWVMESIILLPDVAFSRMMHLVG